MCGLCIIFFCISLSSFFSFSNLARTARTCFDVSLAELDILSKLNPALNMDWKKFDFELDEAKKQQEAGSLISFFLAIV